MKIVVAMDSFKGGLSAADACRCVAGGLHAARPDTEVVLKPMADGGEGTAAALLAARPGGRWIPRTVAGPLPDRTVRAGYAWFHDEKTALVEMAAANGLPLLAEHERNPFRTSTYGTGQLIKAAMDGGARRILLAIGGSATVDGGIGAAAALGWKFLDGAGRPVPLDGGHLRDIARIVPPQRRTAGRDPDGQVVVLCDVTNPLLGERGAAMVFAPQKGAAPDEVPLLEAGLAHLARRVKEQLDFDMAALTGGGAAGGLGAGAAAFFNASLTPGIEAIVATAKLDDALRDADCCITGEGSFDAQSLHGKVVSGVAAAACKAGVAVIVFAGRVKAAEEEYRKHGIHTALATHEPGMPLEDAIRREPEFLKETAAGWLQTVQST